MDDKLSWAEKMLLAWKAGKAYTAPDPGDLPALQDKGYLGPGDLISAELTDKGRAFFETP